MEKIQGRPPVFHKLRSIKLNSLVLNTLFTIALLIMILISFLSYKELSNLMNANKWVTHTYEVIQTIDASLFSLSEIESDQRSYLITGERHFLSEVDGIKSELGENLERLSQLTHDYSEQNQRVIHLDKLIENRLTLLTQVGDLKAEDKLYTPEGLALFNRSNEFSSQAKAAGQEIKSIELALLKERNTRMVNEASFIRVLILGGGHF